MRLYSFLLAVLCLPLIARADTVSVQGSLDPNNPNDVFLYTFQISSPSNVIIQSFGYGGSGNNPGGTNGAGAIIFAGGFDTYFSLFQGTGDSATFLTSNDDGGCKRAAPVNGTCEDSRILTSLAAGSYTLALTLPFNYSFAENYGSGTLGDGFIGLQGDYYDANSGTVRSSNFAFDLTRTSTTSDPGDGVGVTPEPPTLSLVALGLLATLTAARRFGFRPAL